MSVVVPVHDVERWLPGCLESLVGQTHRCWEAVVVDDGSPDRCGEIAEEWAARDRRIRVLHTANGGLGAARNQGVRHARGKYLAFLDSDDLLPSRAYSTLVSAAERSGSDFVTGSVVRLQVDRQRVEPRWMHRLHQPPLSGAVVTDRPEILGDVFAWNKLFRADFWHEQRLTWPEGVRYEDQPTTTRAYLSGRFDVLPDIVYRWRTRDDGSSISQQRRTLTDLLDRLETKRQSLAHVEAYGDAQVRQVFVDRVLAGDLWRYFELVPDAADDWWQTLRDGVRDLWGDRSLVHSGLMPVHRLCGWLVEQDRRDDAIALMRHVRRTATPLPRERDNDGRVRLAPPPGLLSVAAIDDLALLVRPHEV